MVLGGGRGGVGSGGETGWGRRLRGLPSTLSVAGREGLGDGGDVPPGL